MKSQKGFTLVEVLAALLLLSIISIVVYSFINFSSVQSVQSKNREEALKIGQKHLQTTIEEIKAGQLSSPLNQSAYTQENGYTISRIATNPGDPIPNTYLPELQLHVSLQGIAYRPGSSDAKQITVTVSWEGTN
ncbi:prepilin-type N-terminal cleavage/methylation domain-containing protein [Pontibacillus sp. HMF3514]|uniref:prepilin-type N-terminal cleavage/methylation domain-containing protein n=1 Tax=Pontibacillus sp. HMF3514 TaxID=2692425 RepID=UPI001320551F|nr:prepilin-type N-terminal cleavage/methylation domain-containing protein [Pontibacillus sp. HMF3514]QHE53149.1 prepilin-type N-terminal cleavage/methylation domain-containing protein [Pontibacillus sp. HMF3514]